MYLFGGASRYSDEHYFYCLDLKNLKWEPIRSKGDVPLIRDEHTAVIYEGSMVIYGGFIDGERTSNIHRYYFKENKWEEVNVLGKGRPVPRAGHSAIMHGDSMVIFGGRDEFNNKLNDIWLFNFSSYTWEE
jgi:N-acetylneuraminic acid mutarotase